MANVMIDGYNVMGTHHRDIANQREEFINILNAYSVRSGNKVVVVFDGHKGTWMKEQSSQAGTIKTVFTAVGQKADDYIIDFIASAKAEWIVISSDNYIKDAIWQTKSVPVDADLFWEILLYASSELVINKRLSAKRQKALRKAISRL